MEQLTKDEKIRLLIGDGQWHTSHCNHKLPALLMTDGPHGIRKQADEIFGQNNNSVEATCFPTASAMACTWDVDSVSLMAKSIAAEAIQEGVGVVLGCGINIKRSPLCGRNFEYFSEDPLLTGTLATAYVTAMQKEGVGTSLKHFAGNNQETQRQTSNSQIDERALREIYLSAFEQVVKQASPATIMASYNRINGYFACQNRHLLTDILRKEWGYQGAVISDWGATADIVACIKAGMDLEMPDSNGLHEPLLKEAVSNHTITIQELDCSVNRLVSLIETYASKPDPDTVDFSCHHTIARQLASESGVLLQNDGILPLSQKTSICIIGEMAEHMRFQGGGSSHINCPKTPNVLAAFQNHQIPFTYSSGYYANQFHRDENLVSDAIHSAQKSDIVLFFCGLPEIAEGEGYDRTTLNLPANQLELYHQLEKVNPNIILVSFSGSAIDLKFAQSARAILHFYLAGQAVGEACVDILTGDVNPSGKLPESFPLTLEQIPCFPYFGRHSDDIEYRESIFVGYRFYETYQVPVLFPFGHGLSYTNFTYSDLTLSSDTYKNGCLSVQFTVTNSGSCPGKETVQLYLGNPLTQLLRSRIELKGFQKIFLQPGESKTITLDLTERCFSYYNTTDERFDIPGGTYQILVGASSNDIRLTKCVTVISDSLIPDQRTTLREYMDQLPENQGLKIGAGFLISQEQFQALFGKPLQFFDGTRPGDFTIYHSLNQLSQYSLFARITRHFARKTILNMFPGKKENDPEVMLLMQGMKEGTLDCVLCQSNGALPYRFGEAIVLFANRHPFQAISRLLRR